MKKFFRILLFSLLGLIIVGTLYFLYQKSVEPPVKYELVNAKIDDIERKTMVTGSVVPRKDIEIKPQVSGIISEMYIEPGDKVEAGQILAKVKIIPDLVNLNGAESRVKRADIQLAYAKDDFARQKELFEKEIVSKSDFQKAITALQNAQEELASASDNLQLIKEGVTKKYGSATNTLIRSTIEGMVLDVPVKEGNSVIQSNTFNAGTTIATVADMSDMIFLGKIDETEVGKVKLGMELHLTIGALENDTFMAVLAYIAPRGIEDNGAIQFEMKADVSLKEGRFVRSGYSANGNIVLDSKEDVLVVDESVVRFSNDSAYVEVLTSEEDEQLFEKKFIKTGLSDGIRIEVIEGVTVDDQIKGKKVDPKKKSK